MTTKRFSIRGLLVLLTLEVIFLFSASPLQAKYIGGDPPYCCECENRGPCNIASGGSGLSQTEGNLTERYSVSRLKSAFGSTIDFSLGYSSYNADGSRAQLDTVMGYGWTHSYNIFLFNQRGHMFRADGNGRVTKFQLGAGGRFTAAAGYFETLVRNTNGTFTLRQKDGTFFTFVFIPNTRFLVGGPVYRLTSIVGRNEDPRTPAQEDTTTLKYDARGNLTSITDTYGRSLTLTYNGQNKLETITDPLARTTKLSYDATGRKLIRITDPELKSIQYDYNFLYQLTQKIDKDGRKFSYLYNSQNEPVAIRDGAAANVFSLTNPNNWATDENQLALNLTRVYLPSTTSKTDGRASLWKYDYDSRGYITRMIAPDNAICPSTGGTAAYSYDPATLKLAGVTDANCHVARYEYDALGNRTKVTNALGHVTTYTYEPEFNQVTSMIDPNGRVTTYEYDGRGNRIKETDPLLQTREWTYDARGNVLSEKDKRGIFTTYLYDAFGNRITMTEATGLPEQRQTTYTYDGVGNVKTRTDANLHTTRYDYDGLNRLIKETDPVGNFTQTFYDGEGNRIQVIDRNNNLTSFQYDLRKRLIKTTDALTFVMSQTYDGNNNRISITDKNGHATTFVYDVQNRLIKTTDALGNMTTRTYDGVGNVKTETDANNHTTAYHYDELNRRVKRADAELFVAQMAYDTSAMVCPECSGPTKGSSLVTKLTDGNGKVTYFKYDKLDRLILQIRKEGDTADVIDNTDAVTEYFYDANNNRTQVIEPNNNSTGYLYDALNRRTQETNAAGDTTLMGYDAVGNVKTVTAPNLNITANFYDSLDRLVQVVDRIGVVATYNYDPVGNRITEKDGNGNGTINTYDKIYRLTDVTDALGKTTHYDYDAVGNLLVVTDREGNPTVYVYDNVNRRIRMTDALGNITQYSYDGVGNLKQITDANLHATAYDYDKINRLLKETYADTRFRNFTYDAVNLRTRTDQKEQTTNYSYNDLYYLLRRSYPVSPADNFTYDLSGRMLTAERGGWLATFQYDGANRVTQTVQNGQPITYAYNIPGRTRTIAYPGGRTITEQTDFRTRLDHIDDGLILPIVQYTYDLGNRVGTRTYRNGVVANYTYNANNWILGLDHMNGVTPVAGFGHTYDNEGNKNFEEKRQDPGNSEQYIYDPIYRLRGFKVGTLTNGEVTVPVTQTRYDLDAVGNWNRKAKDGVIENRMHSVTNEITKIDTVPILSDLNGNTSEDGQYRYVYDEENRLTRVTRKSDSATVGQYQYDALSRRVQKIANPAGLATTTRYFYDDVRIIEDQNTSGATQATYVYGNYIDEVLTMDRGGQTYYYHQNSLWSVEAITDSFANVFERYSYDAYGLPTILNGSGVPIPLNAWGTPHSAVGNPWMFTGRQLDEETGLYYYRARYYDPVKGRFLQRDVLGYVAGSNLYQYSRSNPINRIDPSGTNDKVDWGEVVDEVKDAKEKLEQLEELKEVVSDLYDVLAGDLSNDEKQKLLKKHSWNAIQKALDAGGVSSVYIKALEAGLQIGAPIGEHFAKKLEVIADKCDFLDCWGAHDKTFQGYFKGNNDKDCFFWAGKYYVARQEGFWWWLGITHTVWKEIGSERGF